MDVLGKWVVIVVLSQFSVGGVTYQITQSPSTTWKISCAVAAALCVTMLIVSQRTRSLEHVAACFLWAEAALLALLPLVWSNVTYLLLVGCAIIAFAAVIAKEFKL